MSRGPNHRDPAHHAAARASAHAVPAHGRDRDSAWVGGVSVGAFATRRLLSPPVLPFRRFERASVVVVSAVKQRRCQRSFRLPPTVRRLESDHPGSGEGGSPHGSATCGARRRGPGFGSPELARHGKELGEAVRPGCRHLANQQITDPETFAKRAISQLRSTSRREQQV